MKWITENYKGRAAGQKSNVILFRSLMESCPAARPFTLSYKPRRSNMRKYLNKSNLRQMDFLLDTACLLAD